MNRVTSLVERRLSRKFSVHSASYKLPTYQHDQCERSLYMHLFAMRKTDLTLMLILTLALGTFCIMLATLAPDSTITEQMIIKFQSTSNKSPSLQTKELPASQPLADRHYLNGPLGINLDLDLELQSAGGAKESIIAETKTQPLGALNRDLNFRTQLEFGVLLDQGMRHQEGNDNSETSNSSSSIMMLDISYQIELSLEPIASAREASNNRTANENKDINGDDDNDDDVDVDDREATETSTKSNLRASSGKRQACKRILVSFECQFDAQMRLPTRSTNQLEPSSPLRFRCLAPSLSAKHKIERHGERQAYKLILTIGGISLQGASPRNSSSGIRESIVKLEWIRPIVTLRYVNSSFSILTNLTHFLCLLISTTIACSFVLCLSDYSFELWSLEQKWTALMLVLLVGANKPMSTLELILAATITSDNSLPSAQFDKYATKDVSSSSGYLQAQIDTRISCLERLDTSQREETSLPFAPLPRNNFDLLDAILGLNFLCGLLLSWTCFVHSIRQISRPFWQFYAPKLALILLLWFLGFSAILYDNGLLRWQATLACQWAVRLDTVLKISLAAYFVQLAYHFAVSAIELRPMSYFTIRFRVQALLCVWILANYSAIILLAPRMLPGSAESSSLLGHDSLAVAALASSASSSEGAKGGDGSIEAASLLTGLSHETFSEFGSSTAPKTPEVASTDHRRNPRQQRGNNDNYCNNGHKDSRELQDEELGKGPAGVLELLPQNHSFDSAFSFLCYIFINNLYVMACAYFYWPMVRHSFPPSCKLLSVSRQTNEQDSESGILEDPG